jgi:hypothetical protein
VHLAAFLLAETSVCGQGCRRTHHQECPLRSSHT